MQKISRRSFLGKSAMGAGAAIALSQIPEQLFPHNISKFIDIPIGFQTYPFREVLAKDFAGTLKTMAGLGYKITELCSPPGYMNAGFAFLANTKAADIKSTINDAGLSVPSCHFTFTELKEKLDASIEFAHQLGLSQMVCSSFWLPATATMKDYLDDCDTLNKIAEKIKSAGLATGFHNHSMEFAKIDGELIYDGLMSRLDPSLVKMQFQTEVINLGYKASTYFTKYPGRFISSHLSDWTADKKQVALGKGVIDWKEFFQTAKTGGVKNFFVEIELDKMNLDNFKESASYIKGLKV
jgi:sugar phosphate isomerase/epimerase